MIHVLAKSALALSLLGALPVTNGLAGPNTPEAAAAATAPAQEPIKFSFEGGTASQLFSQLAEDFPEFPVVLGKKAKDFEIAGFEAIISEAGTIVDLVCGPEGTLKAQGPDSLVRGVLDYRNVNNELVSITFVEVGFMVQRTIVSVLSIQELLTSGMSTEEIMGTVSAGIEIQNGTQSNQSVIRDRLGQRIVIRFHEETGVLFIKGNKSANDMIKQTIEALTASAKWRVSKEAIAAKEALIRSEALDILGETTKESASIQRQNLEQLKKDHEALMEEQRKREDAKDAELERQLEAEFGNEDD